MKLLISGEIGWDVTVDYVRNRLNFATGDIEIEIDSPGGYVFDGISIYNAIKDYNKGKKTVTVTGLAASMASYIMLAGDELKLKSNSVVMIHNPWGFTWGDYNAIGSYATLLEKLAVLIREKYTQKTDFSADELKEFMDKETWFMGKDELSLWGTPIDEEGQENVIAPEISKAEAEARITAVQNKIKAIPYDKIKADLGKIAAILPNYDVESNIAAVKNEQKEQETNITEQKKEEKTMDLETLKSQHSDLVKAIADEAVKNERERANAHLVFINDAKEKVVAAIKDGTEFTPSLSAEYARACISKNTVAKIESENPEDVSPKEEPAGNEQTKEQDFEAKLRASAGLNKEVN